MIRVPRERIAHYETSSRLEWLEANGLGGFASGTVAGAHTRRYHGLLVAALEPPLKRHVMLSRIEESLLIGSQTFSLSTNQFRFTISPEGYRHVAEFRLDPFPTWVYKVEGVRLAKKVLALHGRNATLIRYEFEGAPANTRLLIRPLVAAREFHSLVHANERIRGEPEGGEARLVLKPYPDLPAIHLAHNFDRFLADPKWYRGFEYLREFERGLDWHEDLFHYGVLEATLTPAKPCLFVLASLEPDVDVADAGEALEREERARRQKLAALCSAEGELARELSLASDAFVVSRSKGGKAILAGYHWFSDWGRDAMISLPGLLLANRRYLEAREMLASCIGACRGGLLPNLLHEDQGSPVDRPGTAEYNTIDATLWLFHACHAYFRATADWRFLREEIYPALKSVIEAHRRGTRHNIRMDPEDGLLSGSSEAALTWMDARVGARVVTPRRGKPVEVSALWHNALCVMAEFASRLEYNSDVTKFRSMAERTRNSFRRKFWNPDRRCLYDVLAADGPDATIRPNQVIAIALPFSLLLPEQERAVLEVVQAKLLTPCGLRTLDPEDPGYQPRYQGNVEQRDSAYHQGTVWPWLMGPFLRAYRRVHGDTGATREFVGQALAGFEDHLGEACLGSISEIFDGDPPHAPRGAVAQAWSVAEILDCLVEEQRGGKLSAAEGER